MRWLIVAGFAVALAGFVRLVAADEWEIRSRYPDFVPGDGFMDSGTTFNPYVVTPPGGGVPSGTIHTRFPDFTPGDGFMERGSWSNPYVVETN